MSMMYGMVADAIEEAGLSRTHHPRDFLNFYCLGKREPPSTDGTSESSDRGLV